MAWLAALRSVGGMSDAMTSRSAARAGCQVLIVGAGPTGLMLAAQLLARGPELAHLVRRSDGMVDRFEGLAQVVGNGSVVV